MRVHMRTAHRPGRRGCKMASCLLLRADPEDGVAKPALAQTLGSALAATSLAQEAALEPALLVRVHNRWGDGAPLVAAVALDITQRALALCVLSPCKLPSRRSCRHLHDRLRHGAGAGSGA